MLPRRPPDVLDLYTRTLGILLAGLVLAKSLFFHWKYLTTKTRLMGKSRLILKDLYELRGLSTLNETYEINDYRNFLYFRIEMRNLKN